MQVLGYRAEELASKGVGITLRQNFLEQNARRVLRILVDRKGVGIRIIYFIRETAVFEEAGIAPQLKDQTKQLLSWGNRMMH
jgi:hypothetical protein